MRVKRASGRNWRLAKSLSADYADFADRKRGRHKTHKANCRASFCVSCTFCGKGFLRNLRMTSLTCSRTDYLSPKSATAYQSTFPRSQFQLRGPRAIRRGGIETPSSIQTRSANRSALSSLRSIPIARHKRPGPLVNSRSERPGRRRRIRAESVDWFGALAPGRRAEHLRRW